MYPRTKKQFLDQGSEKLEHEQDRQTDTQTHRWDWSYSLLVVSAIACLLGVRHDGHPFLVALAASAHEPERRECRPQRSRGSRKRRSFRVQSHLLNSVTVLNAYVCFMFTQSTSGHNVCPRAKRIHIPGRAFSGPALNKNKNNNYFLQVSSVVWIPRIKR